MKYYSRIFIGVDYQGSHGKKVYVHFTEYVKTNSIDKYNYRKKYKFIETAEAKKYLLHKETDKVYTEVEKLTDSEVHNREKIHWGRW